MPSGLLVILKRIQAKHDSLVWMHQATERSRQLALAQWGNENAAAEEAARANQRAVVAAPAPPQPGKAQKGGKANITGYVVPGGLITIGELAGVSVWRDAWGPMWFVGGF